MSMTKVKVNGAIHEVEAGCTVARLVELLEVSSARVAVERNGEVVPRRRWAEVALDEGDALEVVTFVGGG
ncbi:MAG TPA: sulfur carrier protein ThiS [Polyangia bacterium]|jgi:thiamine biosynthesis protein ThiS|nr:sulfur carrier protein ThiS [Polyangia bacterium]